MQVTQEEITQYAVSLSRLTVGVTLFVVALLLVGLVVPPSLDGNPENQPVRIFLLVTSVLTANGMFLGASFLARRMLKIEKMDDPRERMKSYRKGYLLQFGLMVLPAIVGAIGYITTHHYLLVVLAAIMLMVIVSKRPRRAGIASQLKLDS